MKIQKLVLYKSSLDREYQNVIDTDPDNTLNKNSYKTEVLDVYYNPLEIYNGETKAIKEVDGDCVISISKEYEHIMGDDYNYAAIYTGNQWFFYFIIGMESMNDGVNPSMLITLERDAWANNIEELTNHQKTDNQQVIRSHFERVYSPGDNKFYPYYIPSNDSSSFTSMLTETYQNIGGGGNVIWCGVRFSKDVITEGNVLSNTTNIFSALKNIFTGAGLTAEDDFKAMTQIIAYVGEGKSIDESLSLSIDDENKIDTIKNSGGWKTIRDGDWTGASMFEAGAPMFYFPCAIISGVNDGIPDYILSFTCHYKNGSGPYNFTSAATVSKIFSFESEEIIETVLTTMPPFDYTVSGDVINAPTAIVSANALRNSSGTKYIFPYPETHAEDFLYVVSAPTVNNYKDISYTYTSPLYGFSADDDIGSKFFDPLAHYDDVKTFEPRIYCAPFTRLYSVMGQAEVEVPVVQDKVNIKNRFLIGNKSEPMMSTFLNNKLISGYNNVGTPGALPTSYDKWKDYLLSGALTMGSSVIGHIPSPPTTSSSTTTKTFNKHTDPTTVVGRRKAKGAEMSLLSKTDYGDVTGSTTTTKSAKSGGSSFAASAMAGAAGGIMSATQEGISIMGNATRPTVPSVKANNNIEKFIPKIVKETFTDIKEMEDILGELYMYGYQYPEVQSIKKNCRVWFDYCETSMCSLPNIKNYIDRERLESAFDRGVTKWHYGPFGLQHTFLKNLNNVERQFVNAEDAQLAFDFTSGDGTELQNKGTLGNIPITFRGTYNVQENGLHITSKDFAMQITLPGTTGTRQLYTTVVFQIQELAEITSNRDFDFFTQRTQDSWGVAGINGAGNIYINGVGGTPVNVRDYYNRTITITSGGGYKVYVDGELVASGSESPGRVLELGPTLFLNGSGYGALDITISKFKFYYGLDRMWTDDEARQHLLSPVVINE